MGLHGLDGRHYLARGPRIRGQACQFGDSRGTGSILQYLEKFSKLRSNVEETLVRSPNHPSCALI
ncbi:hypothetical protein BKH36_03675 [Actinomyces naeslundii]|nr:hypothetical protein BKH36_03675 [Actinomyces naeslundii]